MHWFSETLIKTNFYLFEVTISNIQCKINIKKFTHQNLSRNFPWPQLTRTGLQNELFNMISFARFWIKFHLHSWFIILEFILHLALFKFLNVPQSSFFSQVFISAFWPHKLKHFWGEELWINISRLYTLLDLELMF